MKPTHTKQQPTQQPAQAAPAPEPAAARNDDLLRPSPTPDLNPRNRAAAEIAKRANADAEEAAKESLPEGDGETVSGEPQAAAEPGAEETPAEAATEPQEPTEAPAAAQAPAAPQAAPSAPGIDPNAEYDIIVDGKPVKLRGSQILSRVQKGEAADARLELASRLLEEAKRTAQPQQPPAQGVAQQPSAQQPAHMDEAQIAQLIQLGSPEQAAEAIRALRAQRPDVVTQEGLQQFMSQHLTRALDLQFMFREGKAFAEREYGDLLSDPHLKRLWFSIEDEKRKAGDARPHVELYREIGDELRKHFNRPATPKSAAPTQAATAPSLAQKLEAKAKAPAAPKLASARLEGGADAQRPKSREEIIQEMRKARGQHALSVR